MCVGRERLECEERCLRQKDKEMTEAEMDPRQGKEESRLRKE